MTHPLSHHRSLATLAALVGIVAGCPQRYAPAQPASRPAAAPSSDPPASRCAEGIARVRRGELAVGRSILEPCLSAAGEERPAVLAALGLAAVQMKDAAAAARVLAELYRTSSREAERAFARDSLQELFADPSLAPRLRALRDSSPRGELVWALASQSMAAAAEAAGNLAEAQQVLKESAQARAALGLEEQAVVRDSSDRLVGLLVPLAGPYATAGREVVAGVFAGLSQSPGAPTSVVIEDSSRDAAAAARHLIEVEGATGLIGTLDASRAARVAQVASTAGVPFVALSCPAAKRAPAVARCVVPSNEARARALAARALTLGFRRIAILAPENAFGRSMAADFSEAVTAAGGRVAVQLTYAPQTASFAKAAASLAGHSFEALFVPDSARSLELISPALAQAGLWSSPGARSAPKGRPLQILATADGVTPRLLESAGRYLQGTVLAPGYYPDTLARGAGPLLLAFQKREGRSPGLLEAFAHDAVLTLGIVRPVQGLTGRVEFAPDGIRADPVPLYRVRGDSISLETPR